jgi:DNA-binding transcriptional regulator YdaS (Cro superfamily)
MKTQHPLAAWLKPHPITVAQAADILGCHRVTLQRYLGRRRMPRPKMCATIERMTGGVVTGADMLAAYQAGPAA